MKLLYDLKRLLKYNVIRIKRLRGKPRALAGGIAIGVFIGLPPTMPLHTPLIISLTLLTRTSVLAAIIVSWVVCNPLTFFPIYYVAVRIGSYITPYEITIERIQLFLEQLTGAGGFQASFGVLLTLGVEAIIVLLVGGFVFALPFSFLSYYLAIPFFTKRQLKKQQQQKKSAKAFTAL